MQAVKERAAVGSEVAREEGKGAGGRAAEAVENVITGKDGPNHTQPFHHGTGMRRVEGEHAKGLLNRSQITNEGPAMCKNPNDPKLPKEFETRVQIVQRYPEMKQVEETFFVKEIRNEERTVMIPRTRVLHEEHAKFDVVPVLRKVPKTRIEIVHRIIEEEREVTEMVDEVEMVEVPRKEVIPRVITEEIEERVMVPVIVEVPQTRVVEVPTGNYCEAPAGEYVNPGHFNLLGKGHGFLRRTGSGTSSSSSDDEGVTHKNRLNGAGAGVGAAALGTSAVAGHHSGSSSSDEHAHTGVGYTSAPNTPGRTTPKKKPSLFQRIEAKLVH